MNGVRPRVGQVWKKVDSWGDDTFVFVVVGDPFLDAGLHSHPVLDLLSGERDDWIEYTTERWERHPAFVRIA